MLVLKKIQGVYVSLVATVFLSILSTTVYSRTLINNFTPVPQTWPWQSPVQYSRTLISNFTPAAWQAEDVQWIRDINPHNKIDDLIDQSNDELFYVVVNYNRCVFEEDLDMLNKLTPQSKVQMQLKYITSVAVGGLTKAAVQDLAAKAEIAFIERQVGFAPTDEISTEAICVTGNRCSDTVEEKFSSIDGRGINIAIMDSGVDNGHEAFSSQQSVTGYDAFTKSFIDPGDDVGHGTAVASIALGTATTDSASGDLILGRGVAPGAKLIDVKVFDASTTCSTIQTSKEESASWLRVTEALQKLYDMRNIWDVDIINMSFGQCLKGEPIRSDGGDTFSQLVDLAEAMGIVVVAAIGNAGPDNSEISSPAAATRAITVAGSADKEPTRIWNKSSKGPRSNDGDSDDIDEQKPEVTAPATHGMECNDRQQNAGIKVARIGRREGR